MFYFAAEFQSELDNFMTSSKLVVMRARIKKLIRSHASGYKLVTISINKIFSPCDTMQYVIEDFHLLVI